MKEKSKRTLAILICAVIAISYYFYQKEEWVIIVKEPTQLLEQPYPNPYASSPNKVLAFIDKGEVVKVIDYGYDKDFMYLEVKYKDINGYVILDRSKFDVVTSTGGVPSFLK